MYRSTLDDYQTQATIDNEITQSDEKWPTKLGMNANVTPSEDVEIDELFGEVAPLANTGRLCSPAKSTSNQRTRRTSVLAGGSDRSLSHRWVFSAAEPSQRGDSPLAPKYPRPVSTHEPGRPYQAELPWRAPPRDPKTGEMILQDVVRTPQQVERLVTHYGDQQSEKYYEDIRKGGR